MCLAMEKRMQKERAEAEAEGRVIGAIDAYRELKMPDERIVEKVMGRYGADREYVEDLMRQQDA